MIKFIWNRAMDGPRQRDVRQDRDPSHAPVDREGLVIGPRIASNTADPTYAATALQAVVVARLPPMPDEVVAELAGKRLPIDITFENTPMPQEARVP